MKREQLIDAMRMIRSYRVDLSRKYGDSTVNCENIEAAMKADLASYPTPGAQDVIAERQRQMSVEGWTPEHDAQHKRHELTNAAICYAANATFTNRLTHNERPLTWPETWDMRFWKPKSPRQDLVRAAALIIAEIDRMDSAA